MPTGRQAFLAAVMLGIFWYNGPMPETPDERRKTFEALAVTRQNMLAEEREKQRVREMHEEERLIRQKQASLAEEQMRAGQHQHQQAWRREQHEKNEESREALRLAEVERIRKEKKDAEEEADRAEREKRMHELHDHAIKQKVASKKLQAEHIEDDSVKNVDAQMERDLRDCEHLLDRTLEHLVQDRRKKILQMEESEERQRRSMAERYAVEKHDAEAEDTKHGGASAYRVTSEYKRAVMTLQGRTVETRAEIESEYVRLKDEAIAHAEQKKARLRSIADQRKRDIHTRHEHADEWIDSHRGS